MANYNIISTVNYPYHIKKPGCQIIYQNSNTGFYLQKLNAFNFTKHYQKIVYNAAITPHTINTPTAKDEFNLNIDLSTSSP